jgi:hypothetical protein
MGASVPSESVETTVDKVPLDGVHLKNFCDATKKWFDANKPNAPLPPSNDITSINDDYFLSNDGDLNYYYKPNDYTDSTIVSFGRGNAEEIEFLLWLCAQPKFETRQQAIHAVYAKWQSFLDYKTSLLAK